MHPREINIGTDKLIVIVGLAFLVMLHWFYYAGGERVVFVVQTAIAATSSVVTVSATVDSTISCSTQITTSTFGALTTGSVHTASPNASTTVTCANSGSGCGLYVRGQGDATNGGLYNSTATALIESPNAGFNASATLVAGTEGYGIQGTTTAAGSGGAFAVTPRYLVSLNAVGGLTSTTRILASSTSGSTGREVGVTHKAAIAAGTAAGTYNDTITYSCTDN